MKRIIGEIHNETLVLVFTSGYCFGFCSSDIGYQNISQGGDTQQGFSLMMYGSFALAFVLAVAVLYWMRWSKNWWNK